MQLTRILKVLPVYCGICSRAIRRENTLQSKLFFNRNDLPSSQFILYRKIAEGNCPTGESCGTRVRTLVSVLIVSLIISVSFKKSIVLGNEL